MDPSNINEKTGREWRELGYFYDRYDDMKEWRLTGPKAGLLKFASSLQAYAADPRNELVSEHEHFGPYGYLKVGTWTTSEITDDWIAGPLSELSTLALAIASRLHAASVGDRIYLRAEFAPASSYDLVLEVQDDSYDPAKADSGCW